MSIQSISVKTAQGIKTYSCVLKNEEQSIYQIVDEQGENNPQSIEWKNNREMKIFLFNGLKIQGDEVFTFTPFTKESYKLGTLYSSTVNS
ncbi:hypothetical protein BC355_19175 [Vibrio cholerae]|uniref:Uncharacterized protein n=1 Tax=Vibrio cholerae TaxID=666 RepID=A0A395U1H4_VIBCL|nr:hypothetical protein [Vibrio cholerae]RGP90397.1 hypothetical protein BC355_19175 [Vibrio cholerae]RGP90412.1 hypothetical protein BC353_19100 [Vibrio cholerae]RGP90677.1 hypothetical protein BC354_19350 [Vibrio cholerae]RGP95657.1 hypothetical protein BC352_18760 [Vibrio cholerae]